MIAHYSMPTVAPIRSRDICMLCGRIAPASKALVRIDDVTFCEDCWHDLSMSEIERVVQEVALRGVPIS